VSAWRDVPAGNGRRRARKPREASVGNLDRWLVSYADFVTLLFAFFTTLYAISKVDATKLSTMVTSMQQAFESTNPTGVRSNALDRVIPPQGSGVMPYADLREGDVRSRILERLANEIKIGQVSVDVDGRGVVISMLESGSFPVGSADLTADARELLTKLADTFATIDSAIRVEGHTDDVPIHTPKFASNWELSTARATTVVQYLVGNGVAAARLSASGYGEFHPRVDNTTPDNRTKNRRVDLVILNPGTRRSEEPPAASPFLPESFREQHP
jgi:chemotaxis protein MotB